MADDGNRLGVGLIVFRNKGAAERRLDAEDSKEAARYAGAWNALGLGAVSGQIRATGVECCCTRKEVSLLRPVGEIRERDVAVRDARGAIRSLDVNDLLRFWKRQRSQKNSVNQSKNGSIGANPETKRKDRYRTKGFVLDEHAQPITEILKEGAHKVLIHAQARS